MLICSWCYAFSPLNFGQLDVFLLLYYIFYSYIENGLMKGHMHKWQICFHCGNDTSVLECSRFFFYKWHFFLLCVFVPFLEFCMTYKTVFNGGHGVSMATIIMTTITETKMWVDLNDNDNRGKKIITVITNKCYASLVKPNGIEARKIHCES